MSRMCAAKDVIVDKHFFEFFIEVVVFYEVIC